MKEIISILERDRDLAIKSKINPLTVSTLRMMINALKNEQISKVGITLTKDDAFSVFAKMIKQRKDSAEQYLKGNRVDLSEKEFSEALIIGIYMPKQLTSDQIDEIISKIIQPGKNMGTIMKELMPQVKGKADGKLVQERVKILIGGKKLQYEKR